LVTSVSSVGSLSAMLSSLYLHLYAVKTEKDSPVPRNIITLSSHNLSHISIKKYIMSSGLS